MKISTENQEVNCDPIFWDNHGCMPLRSESEFLPQLERYRNAGVNVVSINITFDLMPLDHGIKIISFFRSWIHENSDKYMIAYSITDIRIAQKNKLLAIVFDIEGTNAIGKQLDLIELYFDLGVRWMLAVYNRNNLMGGGCLDEDTGLTSFGKLIINKMEKVGMVLCCSHTGYRTSSEIIDYSNHPVIFSHSNPKKLCDHPRNIPDDLIKSCADKGGVIGISGIGIFLGNNDTSIKNFVTHIKYVSDLVGYEHVGIGMDYAFDDEEIKDFFTNNRNIFPEDVYGSSLKMIEPEKFPLIREILLQTGFTKHEIHSILGENWIRVCSQVWK